MKKSVLPALVVSALCLTLALIARFAVQASFNALHVPALFGVFFGSSLLFLAFSDYSREPRFRARNMNTSSARATKPAISRQVDAASAWTYTTFSA